jgi:hypothetical protein
MHFLRFGRWGNSNRRHDIQNNDNQHNDVQHNDSQQMNRDN